MWELLTKVMKENKTQAESRQPGNSNRRKLLSISRAGGMGRSWLPGTQDPAAPGDAGTSEGLLGGAGPQR